MAYIKYKTKQKQTRKVSGLIKIWLGLFNVVLLIEYIYLFIIDIRKFQT